MNSPRIACFRTHTIQAAASTYLSPFPNTPPDTEENVLMSSASITSMNNMSKIIDLNTIAMSMMTKLKMMKNKYDRRLKIQREMVEEEYKRRSTKKKLEETKTKYEKDLKEAKVSEENDSEEEKVELKNSKAKEESKREVTELEDEMSKSDLQKIINDNALLQQQIILLSGQLAPIMDRVGRLYTDFSPHLVYDVNAFNSELRPRQNRAEERKRNRHRHNTERQRNRSEENSRNSGLEEDFDDELSNSSDNISRNSGNSQEQENNGERGSNRDTNNIRTRLRSLSNTISQIRSSISSMRNLIFNNLGRGDIDENAEEELNIDMRGRNIAVNVQVPIISSPGDIASVHNIFDRFVDRQMINLIGGENQGPRVRAPRNNQNAENGSNNESSNNNSNIAGDQNNANNESSNTDSNNSNQNIRNSRLRNDPLAELTGGAGGLGFLTQALGGTGAFTGGSDTIELHIHAFMPSSRDEIGRNIGEALEGLNLNTQNRSQLNQNIGAQNSNLGNIQNTISMGIDPIEDRVVSTNANPNRLVDQGIQTDARLSRRGRRDRNQMREEDEMSNASLDSSVYHS